MTRRNQLILGYDIAHWVHLLIKPAMILVILIIFAFHLRSVDRTDFQGVLIDDAYISLRYSLNLVQGHGIVWQPGDRVEGYTNFLWVVLSAGLMLTGFDGVQAVRFLGISSSIISIIVLACISEQIQQIHLRNTPKVGLLVILVGISLDFAYWSMSGLEMPLFIMLNLLGFYLTLRTLHTPDRVGSAAGAGLALAAATLTRPDGIVLVMALWTPWIAYRVLASKRLTSIFERPFLVAFGLYTCIVLAHFVWRYSYYGQPLPNTFYVKVGSTIDQIQRGLVYIPEMAKRVGLIPIIALVPFAFLPVQRDQHSERLKIWTARIMALNMALGYTAYLILIGGDVFETRLFMMVFIFICAIIEIGVENIMQAIKTRHTPINRLMPLLLLFIMLLLSPVKIWSTNTPATYIAQTNWNRTGVWLHTYAEPGDVLAIDAAGSIPYFSGLRSIDMLGLNDAHIARIPVKTMGKGVPGHEKFDPAYVYAQSPTWIATWADREGRASSGGTYRWPEVLDYRPVMMIQTQDPSQPWMQLVDSGYDFHSGFDRGYRYGLWKRLPERPAPAYTSLKLDDPTVVQQVGPWEWLLKAVADNDYLSSITPGAALVFDVEGGHAIAAVTLRHDSSGQIRIQANGQEVLCELYSSVSVPQAPCILPPVGKPGERIRATITVEAGRHPASKGNGVHIHRLLTLPPATYADLHKRACAEHASIAPTRPERACLSGPQLPTHSPK